MKYALDEIIREKKVCQYDLQDELQYSDTKFYHFKNKLLLNPNIIEVGKELRYNNSIQLSLEMPDITPLLEDWELEL